MLRLNLSCHLIFKNIFLHMRKVTAFLACKKKKTLNNSTFLKIKEVV